MGEVVKLGRRIASVLAGAVAVIGLITCVLGGWAQRWVDSPSTSRVATEAALDDDEVTAALAAFLSREAVALARDALLARADATDARAVARVEPWLTTRLEAVVEERLSEQLRSGWVQRNVPGAVEAVHAAAVRVVDGDTETSPALVVDGDSVAIDLLPLISNGLRELQSRGHLERLEIPDLAALDDPADRRQALSDVLGVDVGAERGLLVVYEADAVARAGGVVTTVRDALAHARRLLVVAVPLTIAAAVACIAVANRRLRATAVLAAAVGLAALIVRIVLDLALSRAADIPDAAGARRAVGLMIDSLTNELFLTLAGVTAAGLAIAVIALVVARIAAGRLTGPTADEGDVTPVRTATG